MGRLRRSGPTLLELLEPVVAERLLCSLFPPGEVHVPGAVSVDDVNEAIRGRRGGGCPAPGPDGLSLYIWKRTSRCVREALASLYSNCLMVGGIPGAWKRVLLVLIPKGVIDLNHPKARPISLLDDVGKLFERIVNARLKAHYLETLPSRFVPRPGVLISGAQYGFREGLSTIDALDAVTGFVRDRVGSGKVVLAVSLDIKNAFNSLSWEAIRWVLERRRYPDYLRRVVDFYLSDRWIEYSVGGGERRRRRVERGVPQGSILGPLLWNITYDYVLQTNYQRRPGCFVIGYADNTLVLGSANSVEVSQTNINHFLNYVLRRIENLSLEVAAEKTEAVLFRGGGRLDYIDPMIRVKDSLVRVGPSMKYLGVFLDSRLTFKPHFHYLDEKLSKVTRALWRLMPNLRGPQERKRRLYAGILESVVLYAAPIWANSLNVHTRRLLRRWQRAIAIRVCSAYRSVSFDSATLLARLIPYELLAAERARIF